MIPLLVLLWLQPLQPPTRWPIESLAVEGNQRYSAGDILSVAGLQTGQTAGKQEFEAVRQRLMQTGVLAGAGYRFKAAASGKGIAVTLDIQEIPEVYPLRFERLEASAKELEDALRRSDPLFRDQVPASPPLLERYAKAIEAWLAAQNRKTAVTGKLALDSSNQWAVIFSPVGGPPRVAEVRFTGNSVIPADALLDAIAGVAIGSAYTETGFRALLESSVLPLYEARGRVRAAFPKVEAEKAKDVEGVSVTVSVDEGEVFNFGEVRLAVEGLPQAELQKAASFKTDGIANLTEIDAGIDRVRNRLRRTGYLKPDFRVERTLHLEKKTLDLVVHVDQGPQFHFGKLVVAGLEMNGKPKSGAGGP